MSEQEIKISKSKVLKAFSDINTIEKFKELDLPIKQTQDFSENGVCNIAFELDLSQQKLIEKKLECGKMDCFPLLWFFSSPKKFDWSIKFQQNVACKYLAVKLIDSHKSTGTADNNIDAYNMTLKGFRLKIPPT